MPAEPIFNYKIVSLNDLKTICKVSQQLQVSITLNDPAFPTDLKEAITRSSFIAAMDELTSLYWSLENDA